MTTTKEKHERVIECIQSDPLMPIELIAERVNLSKQQVTRILKITGHARPMGAPKKTVDADMARIYDMVVSRHASVAQLSTYLNVSVSVLRRRIKEYESEQRKADRTAARRV